MKEKLGRLKGLRNSFAFAIPVSRCRLTGICTYLRVHYAYMEMNALFRRYFLTRNSILLETPWFIVWVFVAVAHIEISTHAYTHAPPYAPRPTQIMIMIMVLIIIIVVIVMLLLSPLSLRLPLLLVGEIVVVIRTIDDKNGD